MRPGRSARLPRAADWWEQSTPGPEVRVNCNPKAESIWVKRRTLQIRRGISWALCNTVDYGNRVGAKQGGCPLEKTPHEALGGKGQGHPRPAGRGTLVLEVMCPVAKCFVPDG